MTAYYLSLATAYGEGTYNGNTYNGATTTTTTTTTGGTSGTDGGGLLTNTGFDVAVVVTVACVIALTAVIVRVWKRKAADKKSETPIAQS